MSQMILPPDLELWACQYLRARLTDVTGLVVSNRVPGEYDGSYPLIVVRDDGGSVEERLIYIRGLGVTVRGWSATALKPCRDLAARVLGLLTLMPDVTRDSPVAAVDDSQVNGPYRIIGDGTWAAYYMTVGYRLVGEIQDV